MNPRKSKFLQTLNKEFIRRLLLGLIAVFVFVVGGFLFFAPWPWTVAFFVVFFSMEKRFHFVGIGQSLMTSLIIFFLVIVLNTVLWLISELFFPEVDPNAFFGRPSVIEPTPNETQVPAFHLRLKRLRPFLEFYVGASLMFVVWWFVPLVAFGSWLWQKLWDL